MYLTAGVVLLGGLFVLKFALRQLRIRVPG